jgi:hypothetical protein
MKIATCAALVLVVISVRSAEAQPLTRAEIRRGIQTIRPAVDVCLRTTGAASIVKVRLEVLDGRVVAVEALDAGASGQCIERAVRRARFRRAKPRTTVLYPFVSRVGAIPVQPPLVASALSRDDVALGIRPIRDAVNRCRRSDTARVLVTVRLDIANGWVTRARGSSTTADAGTIACVERTVARAAFRRAGRITVRYPFVLH